MTFEEPRLIHDWTDQQLAKFYESIYSKKPSKEDLRAFRSYLVLIGYCHD